jgi:hypothetical protein
VKSGFLAEFDRLLTAKLASESDRPASVQHFMDTAHQEMNVCPGLRVEYYWPLKKAEQLDDQGCFPDEVRARLQEALTAWDQTLPGEES